mmetsp:Transcript_1164/g.2109  ORF Transcript_1164/g.2109 Transcript_1164/m.2109 type:complete len:117 (+) Transcript_1164:57-407(+)
MNSRASNSQMNNQQHPTNHRIEVKMVKFFYGVLCPTSLAIINHSCKKTNNERIHRCFLPRSFLSSFHSQYGTDTTGTELSGRISSLVDDSEVNWMRLVVSFSKYHFSCQCFQGVRL